MRGVGHLDLFQLRGQPLLLIEFGINAAALDKLMVATALEDFTLIENENFVGILNSGNPVGNNQTGFIFQYRP
jgi:hypothetical protein